MAEWSKAAVLKTVEVNASVGSNPTPSAIFIAFECKMTLKASGKDFQAMRNLSDLLDKPLLAGIVICNEETVRCWEKSIPLYSVPAAWLLSGTSPANRVKGLKQFRDLIPGAPESGCGLMN